MKKYVIVMLTMLIVLSACGNTNEEGEQDKVILAGGEWDSIIFHNNIAKIILEDGYDYDVEIITGSTAALIQGIRQDEINIFMELWTDTMKEMYEEGTEAGEIETVGLNFEAEESGFYVPTYVIEGDAERGIDPIAPDLRRVDQLNDYYELFIDPDDPEKGRFYNGPSSWAVSKVMDEKFEAYNLGENYNNFGSGSQAAMNASLEAAYEEGEPWLGYAWSPTATTAKFDLTLLEEDPYDEEIYEETMKTARPPQQVLIITNSGFPEEHPEINDFLSEYKTTPELTEDGVAYMINNEASAEETAVWWLNENEDVWTEWVPEDVVEKVKNSLH
ncbi:ABC transporter substrate-binding protein [Oceanobacillus halotolerans]|uniref:ABC transporter substrate-binding protein n=1 Tax=Oceanobacillus halotolerans TaxID=2663380 RepID=UPI001CF77277|nr:ABC transporter substrate-binding protein [Oceanobacillus halotolerans]